MGLDYVCVLVRGEGRSLVRKWVVLACVCDGAGLMDDRRHLTSCTTLVSAQGATSGSGCRRGGGATSTWVRALISPKSTHHPQTLVVPRTCFERANTDSPNSTHHPHTHPSFLLRCPILLPSRTTTTTTTTSSVGRVCFTHAPPFFSPLDRPTPTNKQQRTPCTTGSGPRATA